MQGDSCDVSTCHSEKGTWLSPPLFGGMQSAIARTGSPHAGAAAPFCTTQAAAACQAGQEAHGEVARQEGPAHGGVHEDDVAVLRRGHLALLDGPADGAPVVAPVLVEHVARIGRQLWQLGRPEQLVVLHVSLRFWGLPS